MVTWLRIIVSCFCLVLCVLFAALWVQSYRSCMVAILASINHLTPMAPEDEIWATSCSRGIIHIHINPPQRATKTKWIWDVIPTSRVHADLQLSPYQNQYITTWKGWFGFGYSVFRMNGQISRRLTLPIWMPTVVCGLLAVLTRSKPRWRFGLRDLFALTTVAALVIGPLAFWLRTISS
jgi:hypothetical protein